MRVCNCGNELAVDFRGKPLESKCYKCAELSDLRKALAEHGMVVIPDPFSETASNILDDFAFDDRNKHRVVIMAMIQAAQED